MKIERNSETAIEQKSARVQKLFGKGSLRRGELDELMKLCQLGGELPHATGWDSHGDPFWARQDLLAWLSSDKCLHVRSAATAEIHRQRKQLGGATTWNSVDRTFSMVVASEEPVAVVDVRSGRTILEVLIVSGVDAPRSIPILADHKRDTNNLVGEAHNIRQEGSRLVADGRLGGTPKANSIASQLNDRLLSGTSCGYYYSKSAAIEIAPGQTKVVDGRSFSNEHPEMTMVVVRNWVLSEVSLVPFPADPQSKIRSKQASQYESVSSVSLGENKMSSSAPAIHSRSTISYQPTHGELVSALLLQCGHDPSKYRVYREPNCNHHVRVRNEDQLARDAETGWDYHRKDITDLIRLAAQLDGVRFKETWPFSVIQEIFRHRADGFSSMNLGSLVEDTVATLVLSRHDDAGDTTKGWCSEVEINTFKNVPTVNVPPIELDLVPRGGHAPYVHFDTTEEGVAVGRYGCYFAIDEQDLLDGGATEIMQTIPAAIGQAAGKLRPDLVYSILLNNAAMSSDSTALFHADHGNLHTSSTLGSTTLDAAISAMGRQTHAGSKLNLRGEYLIVPQALRCTAVGLARDLELRNPESTQAPIVRCDARLDDGLTDPRTGETLTGSTTSWFLSAAGRNGIQVRYFQGHGKRPVVRSSFLTKGQFGWQVDIKMILGVVPIDYRGIARSDA